MIDFSTNLRARFALFLAVAVAGFGMMTALTWFDKTTVGHQTVYSFSIWGAHLMTLIGIALSALACFLCRIRIRYSIPFFLGGFCILFLLSPALYRDRVIVADDHFESTGGFWWSPSRHNIKFSDVPLITIVAKPDRRSARKRSRTLECLSLSTRQTTTIHIGDLLDRALDEIVEKARATGVVVMDEY